MIPLVFSRVQGCFYSFRTPRALHFIHHRGKLRQMKLLPTIAVPALLATCLPRAGAQAPTYSILHVEFVNATLYSRGYCSISDRGKDSTKLPTVPGPPFGTAIGLADIVSVNGQPVKGTAIANLYMGTVSPNMTPGTPIGDFQMIPAESWDLGLMNLDGTVIGTLHIDGAGSGPPPPGAPKEITAASWTVTGGTGAFFGARGYFQAPQDSVSPERRTTDCEDPAYRRVNADPGGNKRHPVLFLVPLAQPQVLTTLNGPAVVHASDNTPVTPGRPAKAGEILSLFASGLGPTKPGVDPGQPFPADPLQLVNSPVQVLVNGNAGEVLYAGGYPGAVDGYQVNFRLPDGTTPGQAALQLTSAWIAGPAVNIPVQ